MTEAETGAARARRLLAEIRADRQILTLRTEETRRAASDPAELAASSDRLAALALALDRTYTVLESILERVARALEGGLPAAGDWHRTLLRNAQLEIPAVRPPILRSEVIAAADQLRRFRHFLRHAYAAELEASRLKRLVDRWQRVLPALQSDLDAFERFCEQLAAQLDAQR
jgi:hypothetical protein